MKHKESLLSRMAKICMVNGYQKVVERINHLCPSAIRGVQRDEMRGGFLTNFNATPFSPNFGATSKIHT